MPLHCILAKSGFDISLRRIARHTENAIIVLCHGLSERVKWESWDQNAEAREATDIKVVFIFKLHPQGHTGFVHVYSPACSYRVSVLAAVFVAIDFFEVCVHNIVIIITAFEVFLKVCTLISRLLALVHGFTKLHRCLGKGVCGIVDVFHR